MTPMSRTARTKTSSEMERLFSKKRNQVDDDSVLRFRFLEENRLNSTLNCSERGIARFDVRWRKRFKKATRDKLNLSY